MERIAVIGSGIAGLAAARELTRGPAGRHVTLFEAGAQFGGHAHTVDVTLGGVTRGVDTGFLVYNQRTYPQLVRLFAELEVETVASDMSFSVQARGAGLEWSGSNLGGVFAQRANLLRPAFLRMLSEISRFNRLTTAMAQRNEDAALDQSIGGFLDEHHFGREFRDWYFLPMIGCIWSCPSTKMLDFPVATLIRFCHNHGLLQVSDRPQWRTVSGGSRCYVRRIIAGLGDARLNTPVLGVKRSVAGALIRTAGAVEHFDQVVFACHSDQALRLLGADATPAEAQVLGAIRYHANLAVLHTDTSLLPIRSAAWAAWNHEADSAGAGTGVCLHYLLNRLQPLPWEQPVIVSLNPLREPRPDTVIERFDYDHPVFDLGAIAAQRRLPEIQGRRRSWYCGAWVGYGFHEDGLSAGLAVAQALMQAEPGGPAGGGMTAPARPLIGFGRVWHRRLRPVEHAFSQASYFLMLPMRALRAQPAAALRRNRFGALSFFDRDHGDGRGDALAWFDDLLASERIDDARGEVWLHTFPRVLGYVFKPVSFWYAHRLDGSLAAVVAEVNNTFGQRHCYLLHGPSLAWGASIEASKVFHVSPFCAVEGCYRFRFLLTGSAAAPSHTVASIDHDDGSGPLLQTRVGGTLHPLTTASTRRAFFGTPLMTFGVVARIHWQAVRLALKRVPFHRRPPVPERFITR